MQDTFRMALDDDIEKYPSFIFLKMLFSQEPVALVLRLVSPSRAASWDVKTKEKGKR